MHMTLKYQRHWPEDISVHMQQHSGPLLMTSAASAAAMSNGCDKDKETPVQSCCKGLGRPN
eukprot:1827192-Karenia_brevis.AAC.1